MEGKKTAAQEAPEQEATKQGKKIDPARVVFTLAGEVIALRFDVRAFFGLEDEFGSVAEYDRRIHENDRRMQAYARAFCVLARSGARYMAQTRNEKTYTPTLDWLADHLTVIDLYDIARGVAEAISRGNRRENAEDMEDMDVVLAELAKKKASR